MRSNLDNNQMRFPLTATANLYVPEVIAITANLTLQAGHPGIVAIDPASTGRNVTMYTPSPATMFYRFELINISAGTGALSLLQVDGTTAIGTVQPGQRAEMYWNSKTALWEAYIQTKGITNTVGSNQVFQQYTTLAALANAQILAFQPPFAYKLVSIGFRTRVVASTGGKAATLTAQINGVACTGGVVGLTTANQNVSGGLTAGTAITALNVGTNVQPVQAAVSAVTAFSEGDGYVEYVVQNTNVNA